MIGSFGIWLEIYYYFYYFFYYFIINYGIEDFQQKIPNLSGIVFFIFSNKLSGQFGARNLSSRLSAINPFKGLVFGIFGSSKKV